jgi:ADP-ribosylglycohydrolase
MTYNCGIQRLNIASPAVPSRRASAALKSLFVADALAMPVHWFYNRDDILRAFPGGVQRLEPAPTYHPSSIMSLHSTATGGRRKQEIASRREIVGDVILKGRREHWGISHRHYHHGMLAGENTLNAHCARVLIRTLAQLGGAYDREAFLEAYIDFMTAHPPRHPDTYAESYHRAFFANLAQGKDPANCAAATHDTASVGGLVTIAPLVIAERLRGTSCDQVQQHCRDHLFLTHPDEDLAFICRVYVDLLDALLFRPTQVAVSELLCHAAQRSLGLDLEALVRKTRSDYEVIGRVYSPACYISESWPGVLYLALRYQDDLKGALIANTNLGGDNVHRGAVLGAILGLAQEGTVENLFNGLTEYQEISAEIDQLLNGLVATGPMEGVN